MKYVSVTVVVLAVLLVGALLFPFSGLYNVAATEGHTGFARWYLSTLSQHSIKAHASDIAVQGDLADSLRVARGAIAFSQMCQGCHGAPGHDRGVTGQGMTPQPPSLSEEAGHWQPNEIYWIVAHGIKLAGMPAYGPTHSEEELWELVAFVEQLPDMTSEQFESFRAPTAPPDSTTAPRADDGHDHVH